MRRTRGATPAEAARKGPSIELLRTFVLFAEHRQLGDMEMIAAKIGLTRTGLVKNLGHLEDRYGHPRGTLIDQAACRVRPPGEELLRWARPVVAAYAHVQKWPPGEVTEVRVAASNTAHRFILPPFVAAFLERQKVRPPVTLRLIDDLAYTGQAHFSIAGADLDERNQPAWRVPNPESDQGSKPLEFDHVFHWAAVCRPDKARWFADQKVVDLESLADKPVCATDSDYEQFVNYLRTKGRAPSGVRIVADATAVVNALTREGLCVGLLPVLPEFCRGMVWKQTKPCLRKIKLGAYYNEPEMALRQKMPNDPVALFFDVLKDKKVQQVAFRLEEERS